MYDEHDIVADSEEEGDIMETGMGKDTMNWQEGISTCESWTYCLAVQDILPSAVGAANTEEERRKVQQMSSISDFTAQPDGGETSTTISAFTTPSVKPPRPRPRPVKKKPAEGIDNNSSHISMFSRPEEPEQSTSRQATNGMAEFGGELLDFTGMSSIADRAKTRQRKQTGPLPAQHWYDDDDDDDFIAPKAKQKAKTLAEPEYMRAEESRRAKSAKGKGKAGQPGDVLEISSDDDDELFLKKSTPKPKTISSPHTSSLQPTEIITKPPRPRPRPRPVTKKSEGPTGGQPSNPMSDNRTSTPTNPPPDTDLLSSHPRGRPNLLSSLPPSDPPVPSAKTNAFSVGVPPIETLPQPLSSDARKPPTEFDELFSGDEDLFGPEPVAQAEDPTKLPPPPTFFAGSSSQILPGDASGQTSTGQEGNVLDLTVLPTQNPEKDPKPKAKRKKKSAEDDDDDGDWGAVSSKPKEKKTSKKKKALPQVEVVITTKPPGSTKGKGKKKKDDETEASSRKVDKPKEVFKSREIIEDSDEDPLLESYRPEETAAALLSSGGALGKDRPPNENLAPKGRSTEVITHLEDDMAMAEDEVAPVARKDSRRKRKSMVVDDEEDFQDGPSRKEQSSSKRQKKEKKAGDEDLGDGQPATAATSTSRKQKGKAKAAVIVSEDEEEPAPKTASLTRNEELDEPDLPKVG